MKRNKFLKMLGIGIVAPLPILAKITSKPEEKALKQVKAFDKTTVTQAIAAEIMSLVAWNHLNEKRFENSFEITQEYQYVKNRTKNGAEYCSQPSEGFKQENHGITIYSPTTCQEVRIWPDGDWICYLRREETKKKGFDEYEHVIRNTKTGKERVETRTPSGNGLNQGKMIGLYLKLGFYKYN